MNNERENVTPMFGRMNNMGGTGKMETTPNKGIDSKDLKILEQKFTAKVDVSEAKLSGEIDTVEAKLSGKIDTVEAKMSGKMEALDTKLGSLDDKIATQTKRMDWLIALVIGSILVPVFIKLFVK